MEKIRLPAIVTDIDGVLIRGGKAIAKSGDALKKIRSRISTLDEKFKDVPEDIKLPMYCLTNSGGVLEWEKADSLNKTLGIEKDAYEALNGDCVFVNFSPIRPLMQQHSDKLVLISGVRGIIKVAEDSGLNKFILIEELGTIWPQICPITKIQKNTGLGETQMTGEQVKQFRLDTMEIVKKRLGWEDKDFINLPQFHAIMLLNDVNRWDEKVQIILDYLTTEDGTIAKTHPKIAPAKHIPVYAPNDDFMFAEEFRLPRLAHGAFNDCLRFLYKETYGVELDIIVYGKPSISCFEFVEKKVRDGNPNVDITNFYMIGDNPSSDILGGNRADWTTILVRSGVWKGEEIPEDRKPDIEVENFYEACQYIYEKEGLKWE